MQPRKLSGKGPTADNEVSVEPSDYKNNKSTRREALKTLGLGTSGAMLTACQTGQDRMTARTSENPIEEKHNNRRASWGGHLMAPDIIYLNAANLAPSLRPLNKTGDFGIIL